MSAFMSEADAVYRERNTVVLAFAAMARAAGWAVGRVDDESAPGWPVLMVDTPHGQVSWHLPEAEMPASVQPYGGEWDGHTTPEKYERLARLIA